MAIDQHVPLAPDFTGSGAPVGGASRGDAGHVASQLSPGNSAPQSVKRR